MEEKFKSIYRDEAEELLGHLEKALLSLESSPSNKDSIEQVFRVMHTFKGSSNMFGLDLIGKFTHHLETIYDLVRSEKMVIDKELLNVTLAALDHLRIAIHDPYLEKENIKETHEKLTAQIVNIIDQNSSNNNSSQPQEKPKTNSVVDGIKNKNTYYIYFKPDADIFLNGLNPIYLIDELYSLGKCKVFVNTNDIPTLTILNAEVNYTFWEFYLVTNESYQSIKDVFIFAESNAIIDIQLISTSNLFIKNKFLDHINGLVSISQKANPDELIKIAQDILGNKPSEKFAHETSKEDAPNIAPSSSISKKHTSSIRVSSDKLDDLLNMVSELVTIQAQLSLIAEHSQVPEILLVAENVEKISRQLRDNVFSICLIPLETMITRFQRLVRDVSADLNKEVDFLVTGAETELDKTIIESLSDPLMHILRNCLDHGIESIENRLQSNKSKKGTVTFNAFYSGTNVHIEIKDDGAGIDSEKIKAKALSKGLIQKDDILSKEEIYDLLFVPGFSTATTVTDLSGRGVGMDVVKRNIGNLRGEILIDSELGIGTTTTIILPLTLSVVDGLLVKIGSTHFVIPLTAVGKCFEVPHQTLESTFNNTVVLDGEQVPYCYLRDEFSIVGNCPTSEQIIVINYEENSIGIVVDHIIGEYQAVLKPLGKLYQDLQIISGATILGDGTIALVLDTNKIIKEYSIQFTRKEDSYEVV